MINKFISLLNKLLFKLHICVILDKKSHLTKKDIDTFNVK